MDRSVPLRTAAVVLVALALCAGCADRKETPVVTADSTFVYPPKRPGDVGATITFAEKSSVSRVTGKRRGVSRSFDMGPGAKVWAFVDLENVFARGDDSLHFHVVWIRHDGRDEFKKKVSYLPSEEDTTLKSAISIPPGRRDPGEYGLQVYLYRELIAEKRFTLRGEGKAEEDRDFEGVTL
ncbi:MAG: hypothetical protein GF346_00835 [Candidatus Eisenbacteria bacterium]|nr:hypothetical protein [Candidatus Latescibacterota bacterium]MBD3300977.1 hypothetical protein [Candidatus Eisenbacteria bacterium]